MDSVKKAPFRANHVGSLLRPPELRQAREKYQKGEMGAAQLREIEDRCIRDVVRIQEDVGMQGITDGEFRRNLWHADFLKQFDGIKVVEGLLPESARHFQSSDSDVQRSPTQFVVSGNQFIPDVAYRSDICRRGADAVHPVPKSRTDIERVVAVLRFDEDVGVEEIAHHAACSF